jgi:diguanylate cyclase (GGDEF)-like protein/PAS domain S-box-containing protein
MGEQLPNHQVPSGKAGENFAYTVEKVRDYAIFLMDIDGIILTWNKAAEKMKGYTAHEAIGSFYGMLYTEERRRSKAPQDHLEKAVQNGTYQEETWHRKKDGSRFWAMTEIIAIKNPKGELTGFCKITRDITIRKSLQDQLSNEKERAQVILTAIGDAVISIDADSKIDFMNPKAETLTGWLAANALGRQFHEVVHIVNESDGSPQEHQLVSWLKQGKSFKPNGRAALISKNGTRYSIEDIATPIYMPDGHAAGGVVVLRDVTQSRNQLNRITYQATHDPLTRLVNKAEFEHRLQRSVGRAQQSHVAGALLYLDLDQFKIINDTCGHHAGDALLKQLAHLYGKEVRERDTLARLGGDEFGVLVDRCTKDEAYTIAKKILQTTNDFQFVCKGRIFKVGISIGLVAFDETIQSTEMLLQLADRACYVAKERGRNQIFYQMVSEFDLAQRKEELDWVARLNDAIRLNQLQLHYQPIATVEGDIGRMRYEVLLRLIDPEQGIIMPGKFLPVAERYGMMSEIDRWVLQHVLAWLHDNHKYAEKLDFCFIHLSSETLADESFLVHVANLPADHRAFLGKLCFEISESVATIDMEKTLTMIDGLRAVGCKICLADFGKGMASFTHLKQLPADFVKIDGSVVSIVTESIVDEKMIKLVNEIAHLMGKKTIAEWVENQETANVLSRIGIDYLQGYWIAYPKELGSLHSVH